MTETLNCKALKQMLDNDFPLILLDVRDNDKFLMGSIHSEKAPTKNVPYLSMKEQDYLFDEETARQLENVQIVTICTTGNKAQKAAALLREKGYKATALLGGVTAWNEDSSSKV
ncbi:rhodanese-like domain-containing protein [Brevibacillus sp. NRS-1366]|uniref:rhodanese-like domain-containing protein n=1 Tax=Brevibacillus sp. NRS-1366 TaxID=3233899 RepID=UPI003D226399